MAKNLINTFGTFSLKHTNTHKTNKQNKNITKKIKASLLRISLHNKNFMVGFLKEIVENKDASRKNASFSCYVIFRYNIGKR